MYAIAQTRCRAQGKMVDIHDPGHRPAAVIPTRTCFRSLMTKFILVLIGPSAFNFTFTFTFFALGFVTPAQAQPNLDDAQIMDIITTAHSMDIEAAKLAQFKSSNAEVLFFAQRMVTDHGVALES